MTERSQSAQQLEAYAHNLADANKVELAWRIRGYLDALRETCGFESGECFLVVCEPAGLLDHTVEWRAVDVATKETVIRGAAPYAALEAFQPCAMTRAHLDAFSTLPKRD